MRSMIIDKIRQELAKVDKPENKLDYQKFFKEKLKERYGLKTAILRKIINKCFKDVCMLPKEEILDICDNLLESDIQYGRSFAFIWAEKLKGDYSKADFNRFEKWLEKYVDNWASCDSLSTGAIGNLILHFPELASKTRKWTKSKNMWFRRASAVSLITPVSNGMLLDEVFKIAGILLCDKEDLVQKGYGWMLKVAGDEFPNEVFAYVMRNKKRMPRTALRYAIEKYPQEKKKEAMRLG